MNRNKKLVLNMSTSLIYQLVALICGFILPRLILGEYGSAVNGLVNSITRFLGFISIAECGVGAVVQTALYKPLAMGDNNQISRVFLSSERFFRKIGFILAAYTVVLTFLYPFKYTDRFDYWFTALLVLIISIDSFAKYFFGMTYRLLLSADQLSFIFCLLQTVSILLNTVGCIILIRLDASIHTVKLLTSLAYLIQPVGVVIVCRKKYTLNRKIVLQGEPIAQKWNGLAQHVASVVLENTDTVVLSLFSTLENVSVYGVYFIVVNGIKQILVSFTNGIQALFGNMLARDEAKALKETFDNIEWLIHTLVTVLFSLTAVLILPFVAVYTAGITDAQYSVPVFAFLITAANAAYCLRLPYSMMVLAAGHYKQTQASAIAEAVINVVISVVLVIHFGLVGVAIGTLAAMAFRTVYFVIYLSKNVLYRGIRYFIKNLLIDFAGCAGVVTLFYMCPDFFSLGDTTYFAWIILAVKIAVPSVLWIAVINIIFNRRRIGHYLGLVKKKLKR